MTIVIIDDSASALMAIHQAIAKITTARIECFKKPFEGLNFCQQNRVDLLIVDQTMPDLSGIELVTTIRTADQARWFPIVMVTSDRSEDIRLGAVLAGVTDFVGKPF